MIVALLSVAMAADPGLSVDQAVAYALTQASDYRSTADDEAIADDQARIAHGALAPALRGEVSVVGNSPRFSAPGTQSFTSADGMLWSRATVGFSGSVFGGLGAEWRASRALLAAAHLGTEVARRQLIQATVEAYYGLSLAEAQVAAAEQGAAAADDLARATDLLFRHDEVAEVDTLRTRLLAATRHDELLQAHANATAAAAALSVLIGAEHLSRVVELQAVPVPHGEVVSLTPAAQLPEVAQAAATADAAALRVRATRASFLPSLSYELGFGYDTDTFRRDLRDHVGAIGGVTLTVPIFDWNIGVRSVDAARRAADQASIARDQAEREQAAQQRMADAVARAGAARAQVLSAALPDAERNVAISVARYKAGEAELVEVTDAQQALADTRYALNQALFDAQVATSRLRLWAAP